jgi:flavin-dependent dehydrogenase
VLDHYRAQMNTAPYDLQRGIVSHLRSRGVIAGESVRGNFTPFLIPVGGPLRKPGRGRVLLAGDAGGFVNGVTAEGIYYAMVTGDLAAQTVLGSGVSRSTARHYRQACRREIGAELRDSVLLQRYLFADRRRIATVVRGASREPVMTRLLLDFAVGRISYGKLRRKLLMQSPKLVAQVVWERFGPRLWPRPDRHRMGSPGA